MCHRKNLAKIKEIARGAAQTLLKLNGRAQIVRSAAC